MEINNPSELLLPAGMITPYGGSEAPNDWLPCDGSAVDRIIYATLFAVIGTAYGIGDGSTTFNLPQLNDDRFAMGGTNGETGGANILDLEHSHNQGTLVNNTTGAHTHTITTTSQDVDISSLSSTATPANQVYTSSSDGDHTHTISGATGNALSPTQDIRPKFVGVKYIIKT